MLQTMSTILELGALRHRELVLWLLSNLALNTIADTVKIVQCKALMTLVLETIEIKKDFKITLEACK